MFYNDIVYGKIEITEPVILELISSPSLQRLKGIDQAGYRPLWVNPLVSIGEGEYNRFNHSLGVYLLLYKYNATLEEQIAGLIHDVSHSAFSHIIDYVLASGSEKEQSLQDDIFENFIHKTEIPGILKKYDFDLEYILNDDNFPLKEKKLPDLCADRIDYSLRDAVLLGELDEKGKNHFLNKLVAENGDWLFKDLDSAEKYAEFFMKLNTKYYSGMQTGIMFRLVGDYLKYAFEKNYISQDDFYTTDKAVLSKINQLLLSDEKLSMLWHRMNKSARATNNPNDYDEHVFCKSRVVDPLFKSGKEIRRLSDAKPKWKKIITNESKPKEYFIKFEK